MQKREVFIVGKPRSGTSVVRATLLASADVVGSRRLVRYRPPSVWQSLVALLARRPPSVPPTPEPTDHFPPDLNDARVLVADGKALPNIFYIPALVETRSSTKVIHVIRDVRGVLVSQRKKWSIKGNRKHAGPVRAWLHQWRIANNLYTLATVLVVWLRVMQLDEHYRKSRGDHYMAVRYEDFLLDPEGITRTICDFIGIPYSQEMLELGFDNSSFAVAPQTHPPPSRPGIDGSRGDRWRTSLSRVEASIVRFFAARQLRRLDYEPTTRE